MTILNKIVFLSLFAMAASCCAAQEKKISVYAFVAEECPISIFMAPSLKSVSDLYTGRVNFYLVFPFSTSTSQTAAAFKARNHLTQFTTRVDQDRRLTKKLKATVTPEVIIVGKDETILYQGRINDAYAQPGKRKHIYTNNDLAVALENIVNGRAMPKPWKSPVGCYITNETE